MREVEPLSIKGIVILVLITSVVAVFGTAYINRAAPSDPGVLLLQVDKGMASCFVVAQRGEWWYAATAKHAVDESDTVVVDHEYDAEVVRIDPQVDVALIRFKSEKHYKIYSVATVKVGEACTSVGWSKDTYMQYKGHVAALNFRDGYIIANGGAYPGCSGGPLLNDDDKVIGVTKGVARHRWSTLDSTALYVPSRYVSALVATIGE